VVEQGTCNNRFDFNSVGKNGIRMVTITESITKYSKGCLYMQGRQYWYKVSINGKSEYIPLKTNLKEVAYRKVREIKEKLSMGIYPVSEIKGNKFTDLAERYLQYIKKNKAFSTQRRDKFIIDNFGKIFAGKTLSQISSVDIERYILDCGKEASTINREMAVLKHCFNKGIEWGFIKENPAAKVKRLKVQKSAVRYLSDEEIKKILNNAKGIWRAIIITFLESGLRAGELARLEWKDIDKEKGILSIHHTKSYKPRNIPISGRLIKVFNSLPKGKGRVFPFSDSYIIHKVAKICADKEKVNLPDVTCHIFRHTYASRLVMAGVNLRTVQALLGHSNITTTMIYSHLAPDYMKGIGEKLGYKF
jgi:integrase